MILHLLFEDKFAEYAIRQFSGEEMCSEIVVVTDMGDTSFKKPSSCYNVFYVDYNNINSISNHFNNYKAVVFHGLFYPWQVSLLQMIPETIKVAWVFWGGEIYGRNDIFEYCLTPTSKFLKRIQTYKRLILGRSVPKPYEVPIHILKRIDYCLSDVKEDYLFVKKYLGTPIKALWYNYYSVEETLGSLVDEVVDGKNVLIGNSCTIECNHLDGFRLLHPFELGESKVIVPLSYGESWLRSLLMREGRRLFRQRFEPLVEFLPREDYNRIIKSCAVAIMPHYRPQAFGNIFTALWLGTRVYLSEKNLLYSFFKRVGTVVFSLEHDLRKTSPNALYPLSNEERDKNREVLRAMYSRDVMREKNLELTRILNQ